jgi:uncharacterized protein
MDCYRILADCLGRRAKTYDILVVHGEAVARKAATVAAHLNHADIDREFLFEAALLHDIGIGFTDSPRLGCKGVHAYICHGYLGRQLLEKRGFPRHGLVCERHVGVGIGMTEIRTGKLPLPLRPMHPITLEEKIICYADKFFSKSGNGGEKALEEIIADLAPHGREKVQRFLDWHREFDPR